MKRGLLVFFIVVAACASLAYAGGAKEPKAGAASPSSGAATGPSAPKDPNLNPPGVLPIAKKPVTLTVGLAQSTNVLSYAYADNFQTKWMQDRSNVKLELTLFPATDANQKLDLMIASRSALPDVLVRMGIENDTVRNKYGLAGAILPLNDYYDRLGAFFDKAVARIAGQTGGMTREELFNYTKSADGRLYGTIHYVPTIQNCYSYRVWMNEKWLKKLGLAEPKTQEEFLAVLRAFRDKDPNGNGRKDEIPMIGSAGGWRSNPLDWLMNQFLYVDGSGNYYLLKNGTLDVAYDKEEWRNGLRFAKSLVDEGLLSTLSFTQDFNQYKTQVAAEQQIVGFAVSGSIGGFGNNRSDYIPSAAIQGSNGIGWATYVPQVPVVMSAISRDCKNPELAFRWLDMGYESDEAAMIRERGEPGVDWAFTTEGKTLYDGLGYKPVFRLITNIWGTPQKKEWEYLPLPAIYTFKLWAGQVWDGDTANNEYRNSLAVAKLMGHTPPKEDIVFKIGYTADELDQYAEVRSVLLSYVGESMVRFVMGDMDLNKDWDKYLGELKKLKYKEILALDQKAYNRTMGK